MDYKIISANAATGQIEVAYMDRNKTVAVYAIDVPIIDGLFLTPEELDKEIKHRAPSFISEREQAVAAASGFELIEALVQVVSQDAVLTPEEIEQRANQKMWEQVEFEKKTAKALVKFGVLQSDPTSIEVTQL